MLLSSMVKAEERIIKEIGNGATKKCIHYICQHTVPNFEKFESQNRAKSRKLKYAKIKELTL